jgi:hypothetical protein
VTAFVVTSIALPTAAVMFMVAQVIGFIAVWRAHAAQPPEAGAPNMLNGLATASFLLGARRKDSLTNRLLTAYRVLFWISLPTWVAAFLFAVTYLR